MDYTNKSKDHPSMSGRDPTTNPTKKMSKIKQEYLKTGPVDQAKQVMDIIYKKTGVKYHEVYIYRLLHK